ncbi:MAG TPA: helix-turn-helix transcriptional regulator [Sphingomicrobium sp.]|nr:helix-turn-helix transcriptional regulator [Sphingomicrobium sp.]
MNISARPPRATLAGNLRRLRSIRGLSQEALADLAGLHRTFVGSVERAERNISVDNIGKLATALGVSAADLLKEKK